MWATAPKAGSAKSILAFSREELHDLRRSCSGDRQELVGQGLLLTFSPQKDAGEEGQGDIPLGGFAEEWAPRLPSAASPCPRGVGAGILVKKTTRRPPTFPRTVQNMQPGAWHLLAWLKGRRMWAQSPDWRPSFTFPEHSPHGSHREIVLK